jgi:hypothetical protein
MKGVYALYSTPDAAAHAVKELKAAGITERQITVMSSEPLDEHVFGRRDRATRMRWIAVVGGAIGLTAAYFLTSVTQQSWPINSGGMPTVSHWPNMIVMFELTMLGAVLATVMTLLITARLPGRLPALYDAEVSDGKILIGVERPKNSAVVERALREAGHAAVKTVE